MKRKARNVHAFLGFTPTDADDRLLKRLRRGLHAHATGARSLPLRRTARSRQPQKHPVTSAARATSERARIQVPTAPGLLSSVLTTESESS